MASAKIFDWKTWIQLVLIFHNILPHLQKYLLWLEHIRIQKILFFGWILVSKTLKIHGLRNYNFLIFKKIYFCSITFFLQSNFSLDCPHMTFWSCVIYIIWLCKFPVLNNFSRQYHTFSKEIIWNKLDYPFII